MGLGTKPTMEQHKQQTTNNQWRAAPPIARRTTLFSFLWVCMVLVACGRSTPQNNPASPQLAAEMPPQPRNVQNASMTLQPPAGYGGLYVQVSGDSWPQNMMVLVTLEDEQGRSETLAAADSDQGGRLTTGFLFPIDQRWLAAESLFVVATTADGRVESRAPFTIVAPGTEIVAAAPATSVPPAADAPGEANDETEDGNEVAPNNGNGDNADDNAVSLFDEEREHTIILPLIASTGPERRASSRTSRNATRTTSSGTVQVDVDIDAGRINCRDDRQWITVAIFSRSGFDATRVDPGSVNLSTSGDLGMGEDAPLVFASDRANRPAALRQQGYQWRWHLDDVDGDGSIDMVMEFRLDYTDLECNANLVAVTGRTKDGENFAGSERVEMLAMERS